MKNKWRILKIAVTVIILGFLLSFSLQRFSEKPLEQISVNLQQTPVYFIDEKDIREIVKKENPTKRIGDVDIPRLEKKISSLPAVDSANVYLNLNGNLNLDIKQRVPSFRLNNGGRDFYVDAKGVEFPVTKNYSHPCMLVTGNVPPKDYTALAELIEKIDNDPFSKKFFIGISKEKSGYSLLTSEGNYKVEIGDLEDIDFKVKGFKTFVEKYLVYQNPEKYSKISVKYDNQIVTTLNPNYKENDSMLTEANKKIETSPIVARKKALEDVQKRQKSVAPKKPAKKETVKTAPKKTTKEPEKPKKTTAKATPKAKVETKKEVTKKPAPTKTKAKIKVE